MSNISQSHCILSLTLGKIRALSESLFIYSRNARSRPPKIKSSTTKELHFPFPATHKLRFAVTSCWIKFWTSIHLWYCIMNCLCSMAFHQLFCLVRILQWLLKTQDVRSYSKATQSMHSFYKSVLSLRGLCYDKVMSDLCECRWISLYDNLYYYCLPFI